MKLSKSNVWIRSHRDYALTAVVEGLFGTLWLSWNTTTPPAGLNTVLVISSVIALLVTVVGIMLSFGFKAVPAVTDSESARHHYNSIVVVEFGLIVLGWIVLGLTRHTDYIPVWVAAVVGVHFFSLAPVLRDRSLYPLGGLLCIAALIALVMGLLTHFSPSFITSIGVGGSLTLFALFNLLTLPTAKR